MYTPLSDAHVFSQAAVSVRSDLTAVQAELAAAVTRLDSLAQQTQALAQSTRDEVVALRASGQQRADQHNAFVRDGRALYSELLTMRDLLGASQIPAGLGAAATGSPVGAAQTAVPGLGSSSGGPTGAFPAPLTPEQAAAFMDGRVPLPAQPPQGPQLQQQQAQAQQQQQQQQQQAQQQQQLQQRQQQQVKKRR